MSKQFIESIEFFKDADLEYSFDSLTGVLSRDVFKSYIDDLIQKKKSFSFGLLDLDNFKYVNDNYGHMVGDEVLRVFAAKLIELIGEKAIIGRFGGDEFMFCIENDTEYDNVWEICHTVNKNVSKIKFEGLDDYLLTLTTGLSRFPIDGDNYDTIFETADKALYRGKTKGRNCFIIYLAEKHANIKLSTDSEPTFSSMELHAKVFNLLTKKDGDPKKCIQDVVKFLSTTLMIDHIAIQGKSNMLLSVVHKLCDQKGFMYISNKEITGGLNSSGLFYVNQRKSLLQIRKENLFHALEDQNVSSILCCTIEAFGKKLGILRCDSVITKRIWQAKDMDLIITAARLIGTVLALSDKTLEEVFE